MGIRKTISIVAFHKRTGAAASQVLGSAGELSRNAERLQQELQTFLATVRAA